MKKRTLVTLGVAGLTACISMTASANGLLGKHYLSGAFSSHNWSDSSQDNLLGRSNGGSVVGNYNLDKNWDLNVSYNGLWDSYSVTTNKFDVEQHNVMGGLNYLFASDSCVTPYIGGAAGVQSSKDGSSTESDTAFGAKIGAEWDVCEDAFLDLAATFSYVDDNVAGNNGDYGIRVITGVQVIDHLILVGSAAYTFEEEASTVTIGLAIVQ